MKTKNVQRTEQINLYVDESFLFCMEMGKGFIKRNLGLLNLTDYSFENVITVIESLSKSELIQKGLDRVLFVDGVIFESKLITEVVKEELSLIPIGTYVTVADTIVQERKTVSRYFSVSTLESVKAVLSNANFIADGKISITENIAVGSTVSNDMILINMSNYNYELQNYTDIFEFTNGILKTKGNIDYETRLNYVLQIKISDKLDASKFWMDTIDVDIINVGDTLTLNTIRTSHISENSSNGSVLGDLNTLFTKEVGMNTSLSLNNYTDKFSITNGNLVVNGILDYETKASYTVSVKITNTDNVSQFWDMDVNVTIDNVGDTITLSTSRTMNIDQKVATGTVIGDLTTLFTKEVGLDVSMTVTTFTDKFSISGNNLIVNGVLDYAVTPQYIVTVRLTNTANTLMVWDMDVTVGINNTITGPVTITYKTDIFGDGSGIALYKFDGNANDEGGNYHGTETAITYGGGQYERCGVFNGSSSYIATGLTSSVGTSKSISLWVKSSYSARYGIVDLGGFYIDTLPTTGQWLFTAKKASGRLYWQQAFTPTINEWMHLTIVAINDTSISVYKDGAFLSTATTSDTSNLFGLSGKIGSTFNPLWFNGSIDQVRIFNRAITAQEVQTLFKEPKPTSTVTFPARVIDKLPVAHYKFEGDVKDAMGTYNGTATNVTYATGKFGIAAVFNGSSGYVTTTLNPWATDFSISFWAKYNQTASIQTAIGLGNYRIEWNNGVGGLYLFDGSNNGTVIPSSAPSSSAYDNYVLTRTTYNVHKLYKNGSLVGTFTSNAISGSEAFRIGYQGSSYFWNGSIDQVRIFNSALTQEEVTALFNEQAPADTIDDAVAFYKLDGNANDSLGNYNGVATNVTYLDSKFGKAGVFNATNSTLALNIPKVNNIFSLSCFSKYDGGVTNEYFSAIGRKSGAVAYNGSRWFRVSPSSFISGVAQISNTPGYNVRIVSDNNWHHYCCVSDGITIKFYVDGILSLTSTYTAAQLLDLNTYSNFVGINEETGIYTAGSIDQYRVYNRTLSQAEVTLLANEASPIETVSYTKPVIQNDAIAHYKLDGDAKDAMGTYNGTATAVTYADGKFGKCAVFNGTSSAITISDNNQFDLQTFSISAWISTSDTTASGRAIFANYYYAGSGQEYGMRLQKNNGILNFVMIFGTTSIAVTSTININNSNMRHITVTRDGVSGVTKIFVDGVLDVTATNVGTINYTSCVPSIGCNMMPTAGGIWNGSIDQVRIYNRALGQSEVTALFNEVLPASTKNLLLDEAVAYYKMDGNANDSMGNYNGTATAVTYADGKFGAAAVFNGTNSFVGLPSFGLGSTFSISLWAYRTSVSGAREFFDFGTQSLALYIGNTNLISFYDGVARIPTPNTLFPFQTWSHIVYTQSGTSFTLYLNNVVIHTGSCGGNSLNISGAFGKSSLNLEYWQGSIDQARIYDRAITASEVTTLFNEALPTSIVDNTNPFNDGSCKAMYQFNGDATDKNGVYNGTLTGNPTYTTGKFGNAITVGGANYVTCPYNSFTSFSMSFWAKANSAVNAYYPIGLNSASGFYGLVIAGWTPAANRIGIWDNAGNEYNFVTNSTIGDAFISATTFKHYILTKSTDGYKMYINGILQPIIRTETFTINQVRIGQLSNGVATGIMQVDQFRIFNKALTSQEIQDLFIEGQYPRTTLPAIELDPFKDNSCKALYKFEGNALDSNGKYDGAATGVTYATGKFGQCAVFNGTSSVIDTGYQMDTVFSISAYVYLSSAQNGHYVFAAGTADTDDFVARFDVSTNALYFDTGAGSDYSNMTLPTMANSWHHIVVAYGNGIRIAYVDGVKLAVTSVPSMATTAPYGTNLKIGNSYTGTGMKGMVDQVRIFNKVLSYPEVQSLFIEGQYVKPSLPALELQPFADNSCKSYYKFDGNVLDSLGNSNGAATNVSYAQSKFGQCVVLGGNAYVTVNNFWNMPLNRTLSFWIKATQVNGCGVFSTTASGNGYLQELTNSVDLSLYSISNAKLGAFPTVFDNTWNHLVVVETTTATYGYKNGILVFTGAVDGVTSVTTMDIGRYTAGPYYMNGSIDQTRLFNKALTPMEVAALYTETTPTEFPMSHQVDPFKDGSGKALYRLDGNALDESGNYNGTATSITYGSSSLGGRCAIFGTTITNTSYTNQLASGTWSYSIWINPSNVSSNVRMPIYSPMGYVYIDNGACSIKLRDSVGLKTSASFTVAINTWYHIVVSGGATSCVVYVNNVALTPVAITSPYVAYGPSFQLGGTGGGASAVYVGLIDQVRVFNRALTAQEVQALFTEI